MSTMTSSNLGLALNPGILAENHPSPLQYDRVDQAIAASGSLVASGSPTPEGGSHQNNGVARPSRNPCASLTAASNRAESPSDSQRLGLPTAKRRKISGPSELVAEPVTRESSVDSLFEDDVDGWDFSREQSITTQESGRSNDQPITSKPQSSNPQEATTTTSTFPAPALLSTAYFQYQKLSAEAVSHPYISPYTTADEDVAPAIKEAWERSTKSELINHVEKYRSMLRDITRKYDKSERERRLWDTRDEVTEKTIPQILAENKRLRKSAIDDRKTIASQNKTIDTLRLIVRQLEEQTAILQHDNGFFAQQVSILSQQGRDDTSLKEVPAQTQNGSVEASSRCNNDRVVANIAPSVNPIADGGGRTVAVDTPSTSKPEDQTVAPASEVIDLTGDDDTEKNGNTAAPQPDTVNQSTVEEPQPTVCNEIPCQPLNQDCTTADQTGAGDISQSTTRQGGTNLSSIDGSDGLITPPDTAHGDEQMLAGLDPAILDWSLPFFGFEIDEAVLQGMNANLENQQDIDNALFGDMPIDKPS
ncbi:hypothetical protein KEM56_000272 [Ascosphaera pollenicola]|nr:hypothetical protein KEM56_000272 [Ascosphaera pollenicola]